MREHVLFSPKQENYQAVTSVIQDGSFSFVGRSKMLIQKTFFKVLIVGGKKKQEGGETLIFQPVRVACNPTCLSVIAENEVQ